MSPKMEEALGVISEALGTACGGAFCTVAVYAILFVNLTGNGALWDSLRGVFMDAPAPIARNAAVQVRVVPARPVDAMARAQDRMLLVPAEPEQEFSVTVLAAQQPARAADQIAGAPAPAGTSL